MFSIKICQQWHVWNILNISPKCTKTADLFLLIYNFQFSFHFFNLLLWPNHTRDSWVQLRWFDSPVNYIHTIHPNGLLLINTFYSFNKYSAAEHCSCINIILTWIQDLCSSGGQKDISNCMITLLCFCWTTEQEKSLVTH